MKVIKKSIYCTMDDAVLKKLESLRRSKFRSSFRLRKKEISYIQEKGLETIKKHAVDFIATRIAQEYPKNDGKQTPMKNHPVFIAQHATGACCRKCLEKWHYISNGKALTEEQIDYIIEVLKRWLSEQKV